MALKPETTVQALQFLSVILIGVIVGLSISIVLSPRLPHSTECNPQQGQQVFIKAWVDLNGTYGVEAIPTVAINGDPHQNWVVAPFNLANSQAWNFTAPATLDGKPFLFWQSTVTGFASHERTLILHPGFISDSWWENFG
jgi:hypothetical protein